MCYVIAIKTYSTWVLIFITRRSIRKKSNVKLRAIDCFGKEGMRCNFAVFYLGLFRCSCTWFLYQACCSWIVKSPGWVNFLWLGSGQPFMVWVWIWKISSKNVKFFRIKKYPGQRRSAFYLLRSKVSTGWVRAHLYS